MKAIYLDAFAGVSGNMFLGALLDAGFPFEVLKEELQKLELGAYELVYKPVSKNGIEATYFDVVLPEEHGHVHSEHEHEHMHEHDANGHEHMHEHDGHGHEHSHVDHEHGQHVHRNLHDIMKIIDASSLGAGIKERAGRVFYELARAEAKVHGKTIEEVHFHEIGAVDTIIDIVGTLMGLDYLGIERLYVGRIVTGFGTVHCAHGLMPVPAPATAELLQGLPQSRGIVEKEMTTPTGAALVRTLAEVSLELPDDFCSDHIAYGAGSRDVIIPNVLRMYVGTVAETAQEELVEAACNVDDMSGEIVGYVLSLLLREGALDAWSEPIYMKKSRPAFKLVFLCDKNRLDELMGLVFRETTTLGVRYHSLQRQTLERSFVVVNLPEGEIRVKCANYKGKLVNLAPEYEDCVRAAAASGISLKSIMNEAREAAEASI